MSKDRWHQLKHYLKILNLITDLNSSGLQWYTKLKPLYSDFINSSQTYMVPERDVSVNEQLILFKDCSRHTMNMETKAASHNFKIYFLCVQNYLYNFLFTSKAFKISLLEKMKELSDSFSMVLQLVKSLPKPYSHVIYMKNFFTNVKLYTALKELGIEACRTAKNESEFSSKLLTF